MNFTIRYVPMQIKWRMLLAVVLAWMGRTWTRAKALPRDVIEWKEPPHVRTQLAQYRRYKAEVRRHRVLARLFHTFEAKFDTFYYASVAAYWCSMSISAKTADDAVAALEWWRTHGYRSTKFTDDQGLRARTYEMKHRDTDETFTLYAYFTSGDCKFVETGEVEHIAATSGFDKPVMALECDGVALPTE